MASYWINEVWSILTTADYKWSINNHIMTRILLFLIFLTAISCATKETVVETTSSKSQTIYVVRHAEKADDGTNDPPLTAQGRQRADLLAEILGDKGIDRIYSSDYKRTRQTATPLSRNTKIAIASYNPRNLEELFSQLEGLSGESILVVGHSNSTPSLANLILGEEQYAKFDESDYNNLIQITIKGDKRTSKKLAFTLPQ